MVQREKFEQEFKSIYYEKLLTLYFPIHDGIQENRIFAEWCPSASKLCAIRCGTEQSRESPRPIATSTQSTACSEIPEGMEQVLI